MVFTQRKTFYKMCMYGERKVVNNKEIVEKWNEEEKGFALIISKR